MINLYKFIIICGIIPLLGGCSTGASSNAKLQYQISTLSNSVEQLTLRLRTVEKQNEEDKYVLNICRKLLDEMTYEPVIQTELIGVDE